VKVTVQTYWKMNPINIQKIAEGNLAPNLKTRRVPEEKRLPGYIPSSMLMVLYMRKGKVTHFSQIVNGQVKKELAEENILFAVAGLETLL
jgi:hypothetical protein